MKWFCYMLRALGLFGLAVALSTGSLIRAEEERNSVASVCDSTEPMAVAKRVSGHFMATQNPDHHYGHLLTLYGLIRVAEVSGLDSIDDYVDNIGLFHQTKEADGSVSTRGKGDSPLEYWLERPTKKDDSHSFGPVLLAAAEMHLLLTKDGDR